MEYTYEPLGECVYQENISYILVVQRFRVVRREISHKSLVFSGIHTSLLESVYTKKI